MQSVERTCIVCRQKKDKNQMTRIVCDGENVLIENDKKLNGRGAYICKDENCLDLLIKNKSLNRAFKKNISLETYEEIINKLKKIA